MNTLTSCGRLTYKTLNQPLSPPPQQDSREKIGWKSLWSQIRAGRSLTSYFYALRFNMEKINFIYCQFERIEWWERLKLIHLPPAHRFNFTPRFPAPLPPFPGVLQGDGGQLLPIILYSSFFLHPAWVFAKGCSSFQEPVQGCFREIPSMPWSLWGVNCREISGRCPPLLWHCPSLLCCFSLLSFPSLLSGGLWIFSHSYMLFPWGATTFTTQGSAVFCWLVGAVWNHL